MPPSFQFLSKNPLLIVILILLFSLICGYLLGRYHSSISNSRNPNYTGLPFKPDDFKLYLANLKSTQQPSQQYSSHSNNNSFSNVKRFRLSSNNQRGGAGDEIADKDQKPLDIKDGLFIQDEVKDLIKGKTPESVTRLPEERPTLCTHDTCEHDGVTKYNFNVLLGEEYELNPVTQHALAQFYCRLISDAKRAKVPIHEKTLDYFHKEGVWQDIAEVGKRVAAAGALAAATVATGGVATVAAAGVGSAIIASQIAEKVGSTDSLKAIDPNTGKPLSLGEIDENICTVKNLSDLQRAAQEGLKWTAKVTAPGIAGTALLAKDIMGEVSGSDQSDWAKNEEAKQKARDVNINFDLTKPHSVARSCDDSRMPCNYDIHFTSRGTKALDYCDYDPEDFEHTKNWHESEKNDTEDGQNVKDRAINWYKSLSVDKRKEMHDEGGLPSSRYDDYLRKDIKRTQKEGLLCYAPCRNPKYYERAIRGGTQWPNSCWARCPPKVDGVLTPGVDLGLVCNKNSFGRGLGRPMGCGKYHDRVDINRVMKDFAKMDKTGILGVVKDAVGATTDFIKDELGLDLDGIGELGMCYPKCYPGFSRFLYNCVPNCPTLMGFRQDPVSPFHCHKATYLDYKDVDTNISKKDEGLDYNPMDFSTLLSGDGSDNELLTRMINHQKNKDSSEMKFCANDPRRIDQSNWTLDFGVFNHHDDFDLCYKEWKGITQHNCDTDDKLLSTGSLGRDRDPDTDYRYGGWEASAEEDTRNSALFKNPAHPCERRGAIVYPKCSTVAKALGYSSYYNSYDSLPTVCTKRCPSLRYLPLPESESTNPVERADIGVKIDMLDERVDYTLNENMIFDDAGYVEAYHNLFNKRSINGGYLLGFDEFKGMPELYKTVGEVSDNLVIPFTNKKVGDILKEDLWEDKLAKFNAVIVEESDGRVVRSVLKIFDKDHVKTKLMGIIGKHDTEEGLTMYKLYRNYIKMADKNGSFNDIGISCEKPTQDHSANPRVQLDGENIYIKPKDNWCGFSSCDPIQISDIDFRGSKIKERFHTDLKRDPEYGACAHLKGVTFNGVAPEWELDATGLICYPNCKSYIKEKEYTATAPGRGKSKELAREVEWHGVGPVCTSKCERKFTDAEVREYYETNKCENNKDMTECKGLLNADGTVHKDASKNLSEKMWRDIGVGCGKKDEDDSFDMGLPMGCSPRLRDPKNPTSAHYDKGGALCYAKCPDGMKPDFAGATCVME